MQAAARWGAGALGGFAAIAAGLAYATLSPTAQIFGPTLVAPPRPAELALTFDDGPNPSVTPHLLDLLAHNRVRATFFLIGRYALAQPSLVRRILAEGHMLGNHSMTHPRLPLCSHTRIARELSDAQHAIEDIGGRPVHVFRPPHGFRTPFVLRTARSLGLTPVAWNIIGNDWKLPTPAAIADRVLDGIARRQQQGRAANIVLHDGSQTTASANRLRTVAATARVLEQTRLSAPHAPNFVTLDAWI